MLRGVAATARLAGGRPAMLPRNISRAVSSKYFVLPHEQKQQDLVLEEEITGQPPGYPVINEADIAKNPDQLLPERYELWWDDGEAVPESYVDRKWPVSTSRAAAELASAFIFIGGGVFALSYMVGDSLKPCADRGVYGLPDLTVELGGNPADVDEDEE